MITSDRQYRSFEFDKSEMRVTGVPVIFNSETVLWRDGETEYKEVISSSALDETDMSDVVLNIDHNGKPAAKTKNGTLALRIEADGLHMEADLSKNATGRELNEDIENGFYDKMSFAFTVEKDSYNTKTHTRTIEKIGKLFDVSCVTFPAYQQTTVSARSFFEAEAEKEARELVERERKQKLIKIRSQA